MMSKDQWLSAIPNIRKRLWLFLAGPLGVVLAVGPAGNFLYDTYKYLCEVAAKHETTEGRRLHKEGMISYAAAVKAENSGNRGDAHNLYRDAIEKFRAADTEGIAEATFFLGAVYCDRKPGLIDRKPTEGRKLLLRALDRGSEDAKRFRIEEACRL